MATSSTVSRVPHWAGSLAKCQGAQDWTNWLVCKLINERECLKCHKVVVILNIALKHYIMKNRKCDLN